MSALLDIRDLAVTIPTAEAEVQALRGVSLSVAPDEVVGIVGESGGGKSMIARAVTHMLPGAARMSGEITLDGRDVTHLEGPALQEFRGGGVALCFQSPRSALSPTRTVGKQMADRFRAHSPGGDLRARAVEAFQAVGLREPERHSTGSRMKCRGACARG
jgi:peptide/nickel transport system ATP-binding protein